MVKLEEHMSVVKRLGDIKIACTDGVMIRLERDDLYLMSRNGLNPIWINETALEVINLCTGLFSLPEIARIMSEKHEIEYEAALQDAGDIIGMLYLSQLLDGTAVYNLMREEC